MGFFTNLFSKGKETDNSGMFLPNADTTATTHRIGEIIINLKEIQMNYIMLIPTIIDLIKSVEILLPASSGKDKLDAVLTAITALTGEAVNLAPKLTPLISTIVTALNLLGVFSKKAAPVAVA